MELIVKNEFINLGNPKLAYLNSLFFILSYLGGNEMKRLINFTTSIVVLISLTACGPRNTSMNDRQNNIGIKQGSAAGQNSNPTNTTNSGTTVSSTLEYLGARLSAAMILNQTNDVTVDGIDWNFVDTANNWKLSAKRALDQAR